MTTNGNGKPWEGYVRVSSVGKREVLVSPEIQREAIIAKARAIGVEIPTLDVPDLDAQPWSPEHRWTVDLDRSGHDVKKRPDFRAMVERVVSGESGGFIVFKLDRFSRSGKDARDILDEIDYRMAAADIQVDGHTPAGRAQLRMMFVMAEYEWETKAEGFADAKQRAARKGKYIARVPIGYLKDAEQHLVIDPDTEPHIRHAFELRAGGAGPSAIADYLAEHNVRTSQDGKAFSKQAVHGMLKNRIYRGEVWLNGELMFSDPELAIVDLALWTAAQHAPAPRVQPAAPAGGEARYLLTGIARCASCGYSMQGTTNGRGTRIYRCNPRHAAGRCPNPVSILADKLEALVRETYDEQMPGPGEYVIEVQAVDLSPLERELELAERRFAQVQTEDAQDALGDAWATTARERREARDAAAQALGLARAEQINPAPTEQLALAEDVAEARDQLAAWYDAIALRRHPDHVEVQLWDRGKLALAGIVLPKRGYKVAPELRAFPPEAELLYGGPPLGALIDVRAL